MRQVYDEIAPSWYQLRHRTRFEAELRPLARRWGSGRLLNVGCGHGPDFSPFTPDFELWGLDFSRQMLALAQKYERKLGFQANLILAEATFLPFSEESFDCAIAVATYHNIQERIAREQAFAELWRVLKPEGEAFITVWNRWRPGFWLKPKEVLIPWHKKGRVLYRYYYLFSYAELKRELNHAGFEVIKSFTRKPYWLLLKPFAPNICLLVKKRRLEAIPLPRQLRYARAAAP
ncbi:MAG: class I SAM-dependent methyltransferase [Chloroflexota bacterium]